MIEIVYNKGKEKNTGNEEYFCVPKNIRQMGDTPKDTKIYVEDYVYTYLTSDWKEREAKDKMAILLGGYNWKNEKAYVFIKSAVLVENAAISKEHYHLTDGVWGSVYEEIKKYFPGQEIVGWYLSLPDEGVGVTDSMMRAHLKQFGERDKVFLRADPYERECCFYIYRNNRLEKQGGYYIFYEKNDDMQEYILDKKPDIQEEFSGKAQDRAVRDFRKIIARKQEVKKEKETGISWGMAAGTGIVALALVAGVLVYGRANLEKQQRDNETNSAEVLAEKNQSKEEDEGLILLTPEAGAVLEKEQKKDEKQQEITPEQTTPEQTMQAHGEKEQKPDESDQTTDFLKDEIMEEPSSSEESQETAISVYTKYTVRKGDTLSKISMRYYGDLSKVMEICKINNMLEEDIIRPGQTILLP